MRFEIYLYGWKGSKKVIKELQIAEDSGEDPLIEPFKTFVSEVFKAVQEYKAMIKIDEFRFSHLWIDDLYIEKKDLPETERETYFLLRSLRFESLYEGTFR